MTIAKKPVVKAAAKKVITSAKPPKEAPKKTFNEDEDDVDMDDDMDLDMDDVDFDDDDEDDDDDF